MRRFCCPSWPSSIFASVSYLIWQSLWLCVLSRSKADSCKRHLPSHSGRIFQGAWFPWARTSWWSESQWWSGGSSAYSRWIWLCPAGHLVLQIALWLECCNSSRSNRSLCSLSAYSNCKSTRACSSGILNRTAFANLWLPTSKVLPYRRMAPLSLTLSLACFYRRTMTSFVSCWSFPCLRFWFQYCRQSELDYSFPRSTRVAVFHGNLSCILLHNMAPQNCLSHTDSYDWHQIRTEAMPLMTG